MSAPSRTPSRPAPATSVPPPPSARMTGRQKVVLTLLLGAQFMIAVDFSILNVALPVVGEGLGFALQDLQWIATAFALAAAGFTLLFGRIADLVGRKRLFVAGMAVLGLSSLLGGLASSPEVLLTARVLQGLATAAVTPAGLALLTTAFKEGPLRERALGLNGALMSAGFTAGAILGGLLTDLLSWRWAFLVNVPVAALVVALAPAVIADSRPAERPRLDIPGAATVTGGLLLLVYGLTQAGATGWTTPTTLAALLAGAALLVAFRFVEKRASAPLVPVHILTRRSVIWGNTTGLIAFVTETSLVFLLTLYLQEVLGYSPLSTGLAFGVLGVGTVIGGTLGGRAVGRYGNRATIVAGGVVQALATLSLVALGSSGSWIWLLLAATFTGGIGNMLMIVGFMVTATSGLPDEEQGLATGLATMTQQVGITLGIPVMSAIATARMTALGDTGPAGVLSGVSVAVLVNSALVLAGAVLAGVFLGERRQK
ncbi:EmrB/QacA subfamily drug resistance transporter [Streptomyces sp. KhCrAH-43]|uniref:MFS transporter n=1 Tax=unclassified Streptomyces TaxID=2593676 RepID=UPI00035DCC3D|nr:MULTISPECIES: MFS transporter [unclassified Streptomyces]MYS38037.1 MFS transporter [Streptomyces sp. SID4920]MYX66224.1 MFS transporter [Streptomyces sp. SID8373]RAJ67708.1 EmrB/QacA subfamily drug resistance transporter [Streptomyces sp. KhCrAH-43]